MGVGPGGPGCREFVETGGLGGGLIAEFGGIGGEVVELPGGIFLGGLHGFPSAVADVQRDWHAKRKIWNQLLAKIP